MFLGLFYLRLQEVFIIIGPFLCWGRSGGECALGAGCQRENQQTNLPWSGYLHKERGQQPIEEKHSYNSGSAAHENDSGYTYVWNMI